MAKGQWHKSARALNVATHLQPSEPAYYGGTAGRPFPLM